MVDYQIQTSRGDPISADTHMSIYQYPNTSSDDNEAENKMLEALTHMCDQLYDNTVVDYYEISITYDHPELGNDSDSTDGCGSDDYGLIDKFGEYLEGTSPPVGAHLLVTDYITYGCAKLGDGGDTPFNSNWRHGVIGTENPEQFWKNGGIHEVMHNYLDADVISSALYDDSHSGQHRHHDLGKLYCGWVGDPASPMCLTYEDEHGHHGKCADSCYFDGSYDMTLTNCAVDALDQTATYY